ncbi:MAG: AAA family ATPase, partial [Deltaproteobacteria bacterium]|nr:AAA family ATPase [Deltaproteobacteria bacterium]
VFLFHVCFPFPPYTKLLWGKCLTFIGTEGGSKTAFFERFEDGAWVRGLKGMAQPLYIKDRVAFKKPGIKFGSESEKDADILSGMGFCSFAWGGAENWRPEYADELAGLEIAILTHNDAPGGKSGEKAARDLTEKGCTVRIIPGETWGPHKGADVADWIQAGHTREDLEEIISNTMHYEPPKIWTLQDAILPAGSFLNLSEKPREYYLRPWCWRGSLVLVNGTKGVGKTFFGLGAAIAMSAGGTLGPWKAPGGTTTLYLDSEMMINDVQDRLKMLDAPRNIPLYIYSDAFAHQLGLQRAHIGNGEWREKFKQVLIDLKIQVLFLDNVASLSPGIDENSKAEWDPVNQWLIDLRFSGITVVLIHHLGKNLKQRGTSGREDNIDISIDLLKPSDYAAEDGCRFICHFDKHRIPQKDLHLIGDTEFKLMPGEDGQHYSFGFSNPRTVARKECLRLLADGHDQKSICSLLGLSKGYVSKLNRSFAEEGMLSKTGELTPSGWSFLHPSKTEEIGNS